jgi:hypothetical protein
VKAKWLFSEQWTSKQAIRWEKIRAKGKWRFMFINGGIIWGGGVILFLNSLHIFILRDPSEGAYFITSLYVWPIAGILICLVSWNRSEDSYQTLKHHAEGKRGKIVDSKSTLTEQPDPPR